jgi:3-methylfumaryl-CoA hydratase
MTIVTTRRTIRQRGEVALTDEADIIYRQATRLKAVDAATAETAAEEVVGTEIAVDEASLFRFSALTYNAHRIHYDVDYCRAEEDYPDLVVHGPLQALLMSEEARRVTGSGARTRFEFRLVSPLILGQGLVVDTAEQDGAVTTRVRDRYGRVTAMGRLIRSDASRGTRAVPPDAARLS